MDNKSVSDSLYEDPEPDPDKVREEMEKDGFYDNDPDDSESVDEDSEELEGEESEFDRNTVPETPEDYDLPLPEGVKEEPELRKSFKNWAHEAQMSNDQAKLLNAKFDEFVLGEAKAQDTYWEQKKVDVEKTLKNEWGSDYESNLQKAKNIWNELVPDLEGQTEIGIIGFSPTAVKFLFELSKTKGQGEKDKEYKSASDVLYGKKPAEKKKVKKEGSSIASVLYPEYE